MANNKEEIKQAVAGVAKALGEAAEAAMVGGSRHGLAVGSLSAGSRMPTHFPHNMYRTVSNEYRSSIERVSTNVSIEHMCVRYTSIHTRYETGVHWGKRL